MGAYSAAAETIDGYGGPLSMGMEREEAWMREIRSIRVIIRPMFLQSYNINAS